MAVKNKMVNDKGKEVEKIDANIDARLEHHWPEKEIAKLEHQFKLEGPCPVKVTFDEAPANVIVSTDPRRPLDVNMNMNLHAKEPIHHVVCVKVCEPICAKSDYAIGINMRDKPFAQISIRGQTRIFNCTNVQDATRTCMNFKRYKVGMATESKFVIDGLTFIPLGYTLRMVATGEPSGEIKLGFAPDGVRIEFPSPVHGVRITVNNYGNDELKFVAFSGDTVLSTFNEYVDNTVKQVQLDQAGVTAIEIGGGSNEAAIVEVCYIPDQTSAQTTITRRVAIKGLS